MTIQITWKEYDFHIVFSTIVHIEAFHHAEYIVMTHLMQPVSNLWYFQWGIVGLATLQTVYQIFAWLSYPTGNFYECHDFLLQIFVAKQTVHRLNVYIHTLIAEFITTTGTYNQCIITQLFTQQGIGYFQQAFTG